jgi:hypothetical protein
MSLNASVVCTFPRMLPHELIATQHTFAFTKGICFFQSSLIPSFYDSSVLCVRPRVHACLKLPKRDNREIETGSGNM